MGSEFAQQLAPIGRLQFHDLSEVSRASEAHRKVEAGIHVALSKVDEPTIKRRGTLTSCAE